MSKAVIIGSSDLPSCLYNRSLGTGMSFSPAAYTALGCLFVLLVIHLFLKGLGRQVCGSSGGPFAPRSLTAAGVAASW